VAPPPSTPPRPAIAPADLEGDLISPGNPLFGTVWVNPNRMSNAPCFYGTRVPVRHLFDYLRTGHTLAEFLDDFPGITLPQTAAVRQRAAEFLSPQGRAV